MISALAWVRKGAAKELPERFKASEEEYKAMVANLGKQISDMKITLADGANGTEDDMSAQTRAALEAAREASANIASSARRDGVALSAEDEAVIKEFNLDHYDSDDNMDADGNKQDKMDASSDSSDDDDDDKQSEKDDEKRKTKLRTDLASLPLFSKIDGAVLSQQGDDPYFTPPKEGEMDEEQEEIEEMRILPTDSLILATRTEDDVSALEVFLYEEGEDNLYVHHDIMLASFPLCVEWMDYGMTSEKQLGNGNFAAIGTFEPEIEIWNLDVLDSLYPAITLGADKATSIQYALTAKSSSTSSKKKVNAETHVDAVMCLSWNKIQRTHIASGSADTTIKLWDVTRPEKALRSFTPHKDKVQAVEWHHTDKSVLVSGAYDKRCCVFDVRAPEKVASFKVTADVECISWDPHHAERFLVSTEDGLVKCFDARNGIGKKACSTALYTINAHNGAVSALAVSKLDKGLIATGSSDNSLKIWKVSDDNKVECASSKDLGVGSVFSCEFSPDSPHTLAAAGSKGKVIIWSIPEKY